MRLMQNLWNDDLGVAYTLDITFVITILVLGSITGLVALRQAVIGELIETANAVMALNQSYSFSGQSNCQSSTAGSSASDTTNMITDVAVAATTKAIDENPCD